MLDESRFLEWICKMDLDFWDGFVRWIIFLGWFCKTDYISVLYGGSLILGNFVRQILISL